MFIFLFLIPHLMCYGYMDSTSGSSFLALNYYINSAKGANSFWSTNLNSSMKNMKCLKQVFKWNSISIDKIC